MWNAYLLSSCFSLSLKVETMSWLVLSDHFGLSTNDDVFIYATSLLVRCLEAGSIQVLPRTVAASLFWWPSPWEPPTVSPQSLQGTSSWGASGLRSVAEVLVGYAGWPSVWHLRQYWCSRPTPTPWALGSSRTPHTRSYCPLGRPTHTACLQVSACGARYGGRDLAVWRPESLLHASPPYTVSSPRQWMWGKTSHWTAHVYRGPHMWSWAGLATKPIVA